jgi:hypothetical protein
MGWILGIKPLSEWERLRLHGRFGYIEMTRFLMTKILLLCRLFTGVQLCSVHGLTSALGGPRPLYGDSYMIGEYGQGVYFPTWVAA